MAMERVFEPQRIDLAREMPGIPVFLDCESSASIALRATRPVISESTCLVSPLEKRAALL